jgi:hypothetical protein
MFRFNPSVFNSIVKTVTLILLGVLVTTLGQPSAPIATARDVGDDRSIISYAGEPLATAVWTSCTPVGVVAYARRVHVQCSAPVSGVSYFAASTADPSNAARVLSLISTAQVAGRTLSILYDPADTSGTAIGCQASDCRLIQAVGFGP